MSLLPRKLRAYLSEVRAEVDAAPRWEPLPGHFVGQTADDLGLYYWFDASETRHDVTPQEHALLGSPWQPAETYGVRDHPVAIAQDGLRMYNRYRSTRDARFLGRARAAADCLLGLQQADGSWRYSFEFIDLAPGWASAMAQGQVATLLLRIYHETRDDTYVLAAERALAFAMRPIAEGGTLGAFADGRPFLEEYPDSEVSPYTLNGSIFALWGLRDYALVSGEERYARWFEELSAAIVDHLAEWDTGDWTRYSLRVGGDHLATLAYQRVHIMQARVMAELTCDGRWEAAAKRWNAYYVAGTVRSGWIVWWRDLKHRLRVVWRRNRGGDL